MGKGEDTQRQLACLPLAKLVRGLSGLGDGGGDFAGIKLDNSTVTFFDLLKHLSLLLGVKVLYQ
jgi:hypothetical protein